MLSPSLLDISLGHQSLERITERIGAERLVEAIQEVAAFEAVILMEKLAGPTIVRSPVSVAVMVVAISVVNRTSRKMVIVALTGLKTRPDSIWNWADVVTTFR